MMTEKDVIYLVQFFSDQYNNAIGDGQIDFWIEALSDYPVEVLRRAAVVHVKASKWFPKLSEIVEACEHDWQLAGERGQAQHKQLWMIAMDRLSACNRGYITEVELYNDKAWIWFCRNSRKVDNEAAWELARKQTEEWMSQDAAAIQNL